MKKRLLIICLALVLSACAKKPNEKAKDSVAKLSDLKKEKVVLKLDQNLKKEDLLKENEKLEGDIDFNKEGNYKVKLVTKDTKKDIEIVVTKNPQSVSNKIMQAPKKDKTKVTIEPIKKEEKKTEKTEEKTVKEEPKTQASKSSEAKEEKVEHKTQTEIAPTSTDLSGLDTSTLVYQAASKVLGETGSCNRIAERYDNEYGKLANVVFLPTRKEIPRSEAQPGDFIFYPYNPKLGYGHVAVYLGNNYALHGNLRSFDKKAAIASVDIANLDAPTFYRYDLKNRDEHKKDVRERRIKQEAKKTGVSEEEIRRKVDEKQRKEDEYKNFLINLGQEKGWTEASCKDDNLIKVRDTEGREMVKHLIEWCSVKNY